MSEWKWYVYILECLDGTYYTGLTWRMDLRYDQHASGLGCTYTAKRGVKRITYVEEHTDFEVARKRERQIKGWSRLKKEKLTSSKWGKEWC